MSLLPHLLNDFLTARNISHLTTFMLKYTMHVFTLFTKLLLILEQESCYAKGASYQPGLSTLHLDKKHLQKRHRIFRRDREPSRIPARTHNI